MVRFFLDSLVCPDSGKRFKGSVRPDILLGYLDCSSMPTVTYEGKTFVFLSEWVPVWCPYCYDEHNICITIAVSIENDLTKLFYSHFGEENPK